MIPYIYLVIPSYSLMAFIGIFAALIYVYIRNTRIQIEFYKLIRTAIVEIIWVFLGAKILFFITQLPALISEFSLNKLYDSTIGGGLVFYGGLFGAIIGLNISAGLFKIDRNTLFELAAPAFPLFHFFGRIGCFLSGCCYGKELPAAISILGITIDRIPTQLTEAMCELLIFVFLVVYEYKFEKKKNLLKIYLIIYSLCRFVIEFFRGDSVRGIFFGISTAQWICIGIWCYYIFMFFKRKFCKKEEKIYNEAEV